MVQGAQIITDGWAAYSNLSSMGCMHCVVIHKENFVSPDDPEVHTQMIESTWSSLKRFIQSQGGNKSPHYLEYIYEYLFRRKHEDVFNAMKAVIRRMYTIDQ